MFHAFPQKGIEHSTDSSIIRGKKGATNQRKQQENKRWQLEFRKCKISWYRYAFQLAGPSFNC